MKQVNTIIPATIIAIGLGVLGFAIKGGFESIMSHQRQVDVRGLAERNVDANHVIWPMSYSISGDNLTSLYKEMNQKNELLIKFLTSNGINQSEISVSPPDVYDSSTDRYQYNEVKFRYRLTSNVTVITDKVGEVRKLLDRQAELLTDNIIFENHDIRYEYTELNSIKPDMIAEATRNAREAAEQFAKDSESHLGKIRNAEQGYFSIYDVDSSTPYTKHVRVVTQVTYYLED